MRSSTKPEIILVPGTFAVGGVERVVSVLASAWAGDHRVSILTFEDGGLRPFFPLDPRAEFRPLGHVSSNIHARSPAAYLHAFRQIVRLRRTLRARASAGRRPVLISFLTYYNVIALFASMGLGMTRLVTEHTAPRSCSLLLRWMRALIYPFADGIVVLTPASRRHLPPWLRRKAIVIPNPVSAPDVSRSASTGAARRPHMLAVGRFAKEKRFDLLIAAFDLIKDEFPDWDLRIAGDGPLRFDLEADVARRGLSGRVTLLGNVAAMGDLYAGADLFVLSSDEEGFSLVLCEAMSAGLPVVARDFGPVLRTIIRDRVDGWIVEKGGADVLAEAIRQLIRRPDLRARIGRTAASVGDRFALERILPQWASLLDRFDLKAGR